MALSRARKTSSKNAPFRRKNVETTNDREKERENADFLVLGLGRASAIVASSGRANDEAGEKWSG
jgi:hypothetical protein